MRLLVSYDGTAFAGFQVQPGVRTVQGEIESALEQVLGREVRIAAAGRTDAGVHATGQVVSFEDPEADAERILRGAAGLLPSDLSLEDAQQGPEGFHARHSARGRTYVYLLWNADVRNPLMDRFSIWEPRTLDDDLLAEALASIVGTHDFSSFARIRDDQSPVRTVVEASCRRSGSLVMCRLSANAFLHQMVRSIMGSALEVASGRRPLSWMEQLLESRSRAGAGNVAPARGLTLTEVLYEDAPWPRRAAAAWPWASVPQPATI
ncbi:MAG TPA: tRNA pseudouridine(38-40) synthase TruA [Actinomycetota bacterium]|nr:tRNA pseudouridine(38-40) synthase TruA [Actinomycetota bacterium]